MRVNFRHLLRWAIAIYLLGPLLFLLVKGGSPVWPSAEVLLPVILRSTVQASLSTMAALFLGAIGAMGLLAVRPGRWLNLIETVVLLPNLLPILFVIVATLSLVSSLTVFPFGLAGVVLVHMIVNSGLVAVALSQLLNARLGGQCELAYIEGASPMMFWRRAVWPELRQDFLLLGLLIFSFCFTSFAVPMVVGGVRATTIEVLIFERLQHLEGWREGLGLAMFEMAILFGFSFLLSAQKHGERRSYRNMDLLARRFLLLIPVLISVGLIVASGWPVATGWEQLSELPELKEKLATYIRYTLLVGFTTGFVVMGLMLLIAFVLPHRGFRRLLLGYAAPSTVMTAIAFLWWGEGTGPGAVLKIPLGLAVLFLPILYRWLGDSALASLQQQIAVARTLGAGFGLIWNRIVRPQVARTCGVLSGMAALWASGDFAFSAVVLHQNYTLAQTVNSLLASYRLELANMILWMLLLIGLLAYAFFVGLGYVLSRKSLS